jgi:hypothetical protein
MQMLLVMRSLQKWYLPLYGNNSHILAPHRAALMDGLMKVGMRNRPERQHFALNILLNTFGSDLTTLKVGVMPLCLWYQDITCKVQRGGAGGIRVPFTSFC